MRGKTFAHAVLRWHVACQSEKSPRECIPNAASETIHSKINWSKSTARGFRNNPPIGANFAALGCFDPARPFYLRALKHRLGHVHFCADTRLDLVLQAAFLSDAKGGGSGASQAGVGSLPDPALVPLLISATTG